MSLFCVRFSNLIFVFLFFHLLSDLKILFISAIAASSYKKLRKTLSTHINIVLQKILLPKYLQTTFALPQALVVFLYSISGFVRVCILFIQISYAHLVIENMLKTL